MTSNPHFSTAIAKLREARAITPESIRAKARQDMAHPDEEVACRTVEMCRETSAHLSQVGQRLDRLQQRLRATTESHAPRESDAVEVAKAIMVEVSRYLDSSSRSATCIEDIHAGLGEVQATIIEAMAKIEDMIK
jgi:hypothetical protein